MDTNVLVSAFLFPSASLLRAIELAESRYELIMSEATRQELIATFAKPKFERLAPLGCRLVAAQAIIERAGFVAISVEVTDCRDPRDDKFLELALSGGAEAIITGDEDLIALHPWRGVAVLSVRQFLDRHAGG